MHFIAEVVIPPESKIEAAIKQIMDSFLEDEYGESGKAYKHCNWYDWWVIGGRWSGHKRKAQLDPEKLEAFYAKLTDMKITVGGLVAGKEELNPSSQTPVVDALWREWFPGFGEQCWLFNHARDQYGKEGLYPDDACKVRDIPERLTCSRLIIAGEHWDKEEHPDELKADHMLCVDFWTGCDWQKTDFDGNVKKGIERIAAYRKEHYTEAAQVDYSEWIAVTVDCHN